MEEKRYLKWYNKLGYGAGDWAANMVYTLISTFVLIYLTDTVGLNSGIAGTLIMFSKFADGIVDIFFGNIIDRTKSKMGKARPWMLWSYFGCVVSIIALFAIPESWGETAKYAYFFIWYTMFSAVFYTANNIAYSSLTALITKNNNERVQMGSIRFMFAFATLMVLSTITINVVAFMGGGAVGWKNVAIVYSLIGLVVNTISVLSVKELSEDEEEKATKHHEASFVESIKLLFKNKYYIIICLLYIVSYILTGLNSAISIYYMIYVLGNPALLGTFSMAGIIPVIIGLMFTPALVKRFRSIYKVNLYGGILGLFFRIGFVIGGCMGSIPIMLVTICLAGLCSSPLSGTFNAMIAATSDYTYKTSGKRIDGIMFSCSSIGIKVGSGLGSAISGWLLALGGYAANAIVQPASAINMLNIMFLWIPLVGGAISTFLLLQLKVEQANAKLDEKNKMTIGQ